MKDTPVTLESYRLAQYAVQVPCYICGQGNTFDAELCRHCYAPMALTHQAQKAEPVMLATLGPSGVGKTIYLGMLMDMLSRQQGKVQLLARGAFSVTIQQQTMMALARREFPYKTPNEPDRWNWAHCQVSIEKRRRPIELIMPDMAGESILEEVDHPRSFQVVGSFLRKCDGVLILVEPSKGGSSREQDYFAMKLVSYLLELNGDPKRGWPSRPIAIVFSKADQCEDCFADPAAFARTNTPGLWQQCQQRLRNVRFFAAGVAGACAYRDVSGEGRVRVPLRVEPRGIVEPFEWLVTELRL